MLSSFLLDATFLPLLQSAWQLGTKRNGSCSGGTNRGTMERCAVRVFIRGKNEEEPDLLKVADPQHARAVDEPIFQAKAVFGGR